MPKTVTLTFATAADVAEFRRALELYPSRTPGFLVLARAVKDVLKQMEGLHPVDETPEPDRQRPFLVSLVALHSRTKLAETASSDPAAVGRVRCVRSDGTEMTVPVYPSVFIGTASELKDVFATKVDQIMRTVREYEGDESRWPKNTQLASAVEEVPPGLLADDFPGLIQSKTDGRYPPVIQVIPNGESDDCG